jgi:hypothetical protein
MALIYILIIQIIILTQIETQSTWNVPLEILATSTVAKQTKFKWSVPINIVHTSTITPKKSNKQFVQVGTLFKNSKDSSNVDSIMESCLNNVVYEEDGQMRINKSGLITAALVTIFIFISFCLTAGCAIVKNLALKKMLKQSYQQV